VAFIVELDDESADPCEFFADAEFASLLFACTPLLLALAEVLPAADEPA
jgi:hypothetical protein